jgi:NADH-quinone oxidoreductase subunit J
MDALVFYGSALISIVASLLVVTRRNPVYGAIFLVLFFTTISLDFLLLRAPFLAVIQVLVYAGAIMVLYLFVIMLLSLKAEELREEVTRGRKAMAAVFSGGLFLLLARAIRASDRVRNAPDLAGPLAEGTGEVGTTFAVGDEIFRSQLFAFELTSVLILIAIIGAVYLSRRGPVEPVRAAEPQRLTGHSPVGPADRGVETGQEVGAAAVRGEAAR